MKRSARLLVSAATLLLAVGSTGYAADIIDGPTGDICRVVGTSNLVLNDNIVDLKQEVVKLMDESVAVANSSEWINSSRPVFVWASEAKVACGKAYGYLKTNYKDEDYLNKCECFHDRMVEYMH
ncbi:MULTISPECIES: hypothetical protein [unclassified Mesorhizobium]|uniref:hypothetical protein n=1 Tax=unclassified Mesorhizobium TaxID=325217 RepID=UPI000FCC4238|nr:MULTISPECIES: hypothetical protein [unclassified Mesorhizobium]RUU62769.1 hypothetical protein EOC99_17045 [Mesorhizobium sp. M7A.T.Ca.TU.009.01.1.1]RUU83507.1 hypothetical protein EOD03_15220 [Mesorhizobium sp. M7A.T.Ca.TU.009.01.1.2]MCQ8874335.1 hypothetical protein [Mesorhizobium sp. LMG17149]RUT87768.1 hypothetical protein EOD14_09110 [Mesorhizobium sp. M7A.T.Ca.US.000.02.1.1]RUT94141.1 hypothetical protein EOD15_03335 [Mesorhizobium sp. M7A.T.Ca.US.000.02.2.1]